MDVKTVVIRWVVFGVLTVAVGLLVLGLVHLGD
jgi:hypothetical protein